MGDNTETGAETVVLATDETVETQTANDQGNQTLPIAGDDELEVKVKKSMLGIKPGDQAPLHKANQISLNSTKHLVHKGRHARRTSPHPDSLDGKVLAQNGKTGQKPARAVTNT